MVWKEFPLNPIPESFLNSFRIGDLKLFKIHWEPLRFQHKVALVLEKDEASAILRLVKERGIFFRNYIVHSITEIEEGFPCVIGSYFS